MSLSYEDKLATKAFDPGHTCFHNLWCNDKLLMCPNFPSLAHLIWKCLNGNRGCPNWNFWDKVKCPCSIATFNAPMIGQHNPSTSNFFFFFFFFFGFSFINWVDTIGDVFKLWTSLMGSLSHGPHLLQVLAKSWSKSDVWENCLSCHNFSKEIVEGCNKTSRSNRQFLRWTWELNRRKKWTFVHVSQEVPPLYNWGGGGGGVGGVSPGFGFCWGVGGGDCLFFNLFPMCSHHVHNIFPEAPQFHLILFGSSSTSMYV